MGRPYSLINPRKLKVNDKVINKTVFTLKSRNSMKMEARKQIFF